jgi:Na+-transporting NADH:ubiquinone oxidoreductase subunit C
LATGKVDEGVDPRTFNVRKAADDPARSVAIPADQDIAQIKRRANDALIYLVKDGERIKSIILPIHGRGLYSTLYGFIALRNDGSTVEGLSFYEHGETPGLGGEVDNPRWRNQWVGKRIYDDKGELKFQVIKGGVDTSRPDAQYQVDAIAGATLTSRGVNNLMRYWFSDAGYLPLLQRLTHHDS